MSSTDMTWAVPGAEAVSYCTTDYGRGYYLGERHGRQVLAALEDAATDGAVDEEE